MFEECRVGRDHCEPCGREDFYPANEFEFSSEECETFTEAKQERKGISSLPPPTFLHISREIFLPLIITQTQASHYPCDKSLAIPHHLVVQTPQWYAQCWGLAPVHLHPHFLQHFLCFMNYQEVDVSSQQWLPRLLSEQQCASLWALEFGKAVSQKCQVRILAWERDKLARQEFRAVKRDNESCSLDL